MSRIPRLQSESGFYHIYSRGSGRQIIFESDDDRIAFLHCLNAALIEFNATVYAYALMGNHYHLVVNVEYENLSSFGHKLNCAYANRFNNTHDRSGHLLQERFSSDPIDNDSYLLAAIRYVHRNPVEANLAKTCTDCQWTSYAYYEDETQYLVSRFITSNSKIPYVPVKTQKAIEMLDTPEAFREFHSHSGKEFFSDDHPTPIQKSEEEILAIAREALAGKNPTTLKSLSKSDRNRNLRILKETTTLTFTQIALITGISRSTICRA